MISILLYCVAGVFAASFLTHYVVIKNHRFCEDSVDTNKPQRIHACATSRAGGLGVFLASAVVISFYLKGGSSVVLTAMPAFLVGFYEDLHSNVAPKSRLLLLAIGACSAIVLLDCVVRQVGVLTLPEPFAIAFTIFAIVGVINSINIIDGLNGLASGVSVVSFAVIGIAGYMVSDSLIMGISIFVIASLLGFMVWNFPNGKIFLGDGGAYYIGSVFAVTSILLLHRHHEVSVVFPVAALIYPIFEVLFSIYRRKTRKGGKAMTPDGLHLHTLIYKRLTCKSKWVSALIWVVMAAVVLPSLFVIDDTVSLIVICAVFIAIYIGTYRTIVHFKADKVKDVLASEYTFQRRRLRKKSQLPALLNLRRQEAVKRYS